MNHGKHLKIVGIIQIALGAIPMLLGLIMFVGIVSGELSADRLGTTTTTATLIALFLLLAAPLPSMIGGIGLLRWYGWARPLLIVMGALDLLAPPFGAAAGAYTLWVLLKPETRELLASKSRSLK